MSSYEFNDATERRLLANDPTATSLWLRKYSGLTAPDIVRVATALDASTHVQRLVLHFELFNPTVLWTAAAIPTVSVEERRQVVTAMIKIQASIATNPALQSLTLNGYRRSTMGSQMLPGYLNNICLRPQLGKDALKKLTLTALSVTADDLIMLLDDAELEDFTMEYCDIVPGSFATEQLAVQRVAQCFVDNVFLDKLSIDVTNWNAAYFCAILDALHHAPHPLDCLQLCKHTSENLPVAAVTAMANLFRASLHKLDDVRLDSFDWTADLLRPIAASIRDSSEIAANVQLLNGSMDAAACTELQSIFAKHGTTHSLWLGGNITFPKENKQYPVLVDLVSGGCPGLRCLRLVQFTEYGDSIRRFRAILRGLCLPSCTVQDLILEDLGEAHVEVLLKRLPYFTTISSIAFDLKNMSTHFHSRLLTALRRNRTLLMTNITGQNDAATATDRVHKLQAYLNRNGALVPAVKAEVSMGVSHSWKHGHGTVAPSLFCALETRSVQGACFMAGLLAQCEQQIGTAHSSSPLSGRKRLQSLEGSETAAATPSKRRRQI